MAYRKKQIPILVPWITKAGYLDLTKLPIDVILAQAVGDDGEKFRSACRILGLMASAGRIEAEIIHSDRNGQGMIL